MKQNATLKILLLAISVLFVTTATNAQAANSPYWYEGFNASQGCDLTISSPSTFSGSYFNTNNGSWYQAGCFKTTGTGCPAGNDHIRAKNISGFTDSGYIITPKVANGIQELHFSRARASRVYSVAITDDTSATTTNWTQVYFIRSYIGTITCTDTMITINAASAKRLRIKFSGGTDSDIDSVWITRYSALSPLPITLLSFIGKKETSTNLLNWTTSMEQNNAYFNVQRSPNAKDFTTIGKVETKATNGNSTTQLNYNFTDIKPSFGGQGDFYRLQQVDIDGKSTFSSIIKLSNYQISTFGIYPNPVKDIATISGATIGSKAIIYDVNGKVLKQIKVTANTFTVNMSQYNSGIYLLKTSNGPTQKIIKQ